MHQESASSISSSTPSSSMWSIMNSWFTPTVLFVLLNLIIGFIAYTSSLTTQKHSRNKPKVTNSSPSLLQRLKSINSHHQNLESQNSPLNQDTDTSFESDHNVLTRNLETTTFAHESLSHNFFQENLHSQVHHIFSETHELNYQETSAQFVLDQKDLTFDDFQMPIEENVLESGEHNITHEFGKRTNGDFINFSQSHEENNQETPKDLIFDDFQQNHEEKLLEDSVNEVSSKVKDSNFMRTVSDIACLTSGLGHLEAEEINKVEARRPKTVRERTDGDEEVDSKADDFINRFKHQLKLQRLDSAVRYRDVLARGSGAK